jgi:hypothetical protein
MIQPRKLWVPALICLALSVLGYLSFFLFAHILADRISAVLMKRPEYVPINWDPATHLASLIGPLAAIAFGIVAVIRGSREARKLDLKAPLPAVTVAIVGMSASGILVALGALGLLVGLIFGLGKELI